MNTFIDNEIKSQQKYRYLNVPVYNGRERKY